MKKLMLLEVITIFFLRLIEYFPQPPNSRQILGEKLPRRVPDAKYAYFIMDLNYFAIPAMGFQVPGSSRGKNPGCRGKYFLMQWKIIAIVY